MRYEYTITQEGGEAETMKAMSWKKLFKSLLLKKDTRKSGLLKKGKRHENEKYEI